MAQARKAVHAYLSDEAHEQWHQAAQSWGISVSALLEALGSELDHIESLFEARDNTIVLTARGIDARRRRRQP